MLDWAFLSLYFFFSCILIMSLQNGAVHQNQNTKLKYFHEDILNTMLQMKREREALSLSRKWFLN